MTLRSCSQCRRHFADESACPFCAAPAPPLVPRRFSTARMSRAAAFAGAALAGCYTDNPPPASPRVEQQQQQQQQQEQEQEQPTQQHFANPPPPIAGHSRIEGVVTDQTGQPQPNRLVELNVGQRPPRFLQRTQTDQNGHYQFVDLPAGDYIVDFGYLNGRRGHMQRVVSLGDNDAQTADARIPINVPTNQPMPYGAPPRRYRVV